MAEWKFEPGHSAAEFSVKHMMVTWLRGAIKNAEGSMQFDPENLEKSSAEAVIDAKELWTGDQERDDHLRSEDFLDVENHPKITFKSDNAEVMDKNRFRLNGDLTIRGITKKVTLDVDYLGQRQTPFWVGSVDKGPKMRAGFVVRTTINRHDFGVSWDSKLEDGGAVVGDDVHIIVDIEAIMN